MLIVNYFKAEDVLRQNCKVGRTYKKCNPAVLCSPVSEFDMIESCKTCKKHL